MHEVKQQNSDHICAETGLFKRRQERGETARVSSSDILDSRLSNAAACTEAASCVMETLVEHSLGSILTQGGHNAHGACACWALLDSGLAADAAGCLHTKRHDVVMCWS